MTEIAKTLILVGRGETSEDDKRRLEKSGFVVAECVDPDAIRLVRSAPTMSRGEIVACVAKALSDVCRLLALDEEADGGGEAEKDGAAQ